VINGVIELYKNIWNEPISDVPVVFSEQREKLCMFTFTSNLHLIPFPAPHSLFPAEVDKTTEVRYNFGILVNNENAKNHS
jgi:hypothetical protein